MFVLEVWGMTTDVEVAQILGSHLRGWRKVLNLTAVQLAERAEINVDTLRRLELGRGGVSSLHLLAVLRALGVTHKMMHALDPLESDVGRARIDQLARTRVRP